MMIGFMLHSLAAIVPVVGSGEPGQCASTHHREAGQDRERPPIARPEGAVEEVAHEGAARLDGDGREPEVDRLHGHTYIMPARRVSTESYTNGCLILATRSDAGHGPPLDGLSRA